MKVAIIGRGFGEYAMKPAFEAQGWTVEIVPSRDAGAVAAACASDADLISIHSPPFQHREHVLAAVAAGKHVLCDKPFGLNGAEAREMRDAAAAAGVLHFLNFEFRHNAGRIKVQQLIDSGTIGTLGHVSHTGFAGYMRRRKHGWLNDASLGGGWLGALGSHLIDVLRWHFASEIADCGGMARLDVPVRSDGEGGEVTGTAEDAYALWFTLANGGTAAIDVASAAAAGLPSRAVFLGSEGTIEMLDETTLTLLRPGAEPETFDCSAAPGDPAWPAVYSWIGAVGAAIAERRQITPGFDDGVATAEVMDLLKARMVRPGAGVV